MITHLIIMSVDESQFEFVFCRVNIENPGPAFSVHTIHLAALHSGDVDRHVQGPHNSRISINEK